jgi:folate-binding Fe-S cluster repair protein YgfZ
MLNLDLLDGISFSKGCYTGQEIIARTQHLGRIKRRLYRLQLPGGDWRVGQHVHLSDGRAGRLVEVAQSSDGFEALAVLNVEPVLNVEAALNVGAALNVATSGASQSGDGESAVDAPIAAAGLPLPYKV